MSTNANNQIAGREAQESSGQSSEMKITVEIPAEIVAPNHRRAYAMAYVAGFKGEKLKFVAPIVRNSIVRGYLTGERERAAANAITKAVLMVDKYTGRKFHQAHA